MNSLGWALAHQGGWDEMLFVAVPIALFAGLLWMANRRAQAHLEAAERGTEAGDEVPADPDQS